MQLHCKMQNHPLIFYSNTQPELSGPCKFTGCCKTWILLLKCLRLLKGLLQGHTVSLFLSWLFNNYVTISPSLILDLTDRRHLVMGQKGQNAIYIHNCLFVRWHPVAKCTNHHVRAALAESSAPLGCVRVCLSDDNKTSPGLSIIISFFVSASARLPPFSETSLLLSFHGQHIFCSVVSIAMAARAHDDRAFQTRVGALKDDCSLSTTSIFSPSQQSSCLSLHLLWLSLIPLDNLTLLQFVRLFFSLSVARSQPNV